MSEKMTIEPGLVLVRIDYPDVAARSVSTWVVDRVLKRDVVLKGRSDSEKEARFRLTDVREHEVVVSGGNSWAAGREVYVLPDDPRVSKARSQIDERNCAHGLIKAYDAARTSLLRGRPVEEVKAIQDACARYLAAAKVSERIGA